MKPLIFLLLFAGSLRVDAFGQQLPGGGETVGLIQIRGRIDEVELDVVARSIAALDSRFAAVIIDIDSPGGEYDGIDKIFDAADAIDIPMYALVRNRAVASAAFLVLLADSAFMIRGSRIGASAIPRLDDDELESIKVMYGVLASRRGIPEEIGHAFVDIGIFLPGIVEPTALLQVGAETAVQIGLVDGIVTGEVDLIKRVGLEGANFEDVRLASPTTIVVENRNWSDARVFLVRSGARFRLGTVTSMSTQRFRLRQPLTNGSRIKVLAELIGSQETLSTDEIVVEDGLLIEWSIENVLSNSSFFVTRSR